jgi:hypothetical protein
MQQVTAEASTVKREVKIGAETSRMLARNAIGFGIADVLDAAITPGGTTDLRRSIITVAYNYETESFEIRWDIAK